MEIERKFLVRKIPDLSGKASIPYERYYLKINADSEERIQKKADKYEREIKIFRSDLSSDTKKEELSKDEFENLKKSTSKPILRESYKISEDPEITIKIYHGDHEDLIRAEVEFESEEEAKQFWTY